MSFIVEIKIKKRIISDLRQIDYRYYDMLNGFDHLIVLKMKMTPI